MDRPRRVVAPARGEVTARRSFRSPRAGRVAPLQSGLVDVYCWRTLAARRSRHQILRPDQSMPSNDELLFVASDLADSSASNTADDGLVESGSITHHSDMK